MIDVLKSVKAVNSDITLKYTQKDLIKLAQLEIKRQTGVDLELDFNTEELSKTGRYYFEVLNKNNLNITQEETLYDCEFNIDNKKEFTQIVLIDLFDTYTQINYVKNLIGKTITDDTLIPITIDFTTYLEILTIHVKLDKEMSEILNPFSERNLRKSKDYIPKLR